MTARYAVSVGKGRRERRLEVAEWDAVAQGRHEHVIGKPAVGRAAQERDLGTQLFVADGAGFTSTTAERAVHEHGSQTVDPAGHLVPEHTRERDRIGAAREV